MLLHLEDLISLVSYLLLLSFSSDAYYILSKVLVKPPVQSQLGLSSLLSSPGELKRYSQHPDSLQGGDVCLQSIILGPDLGCILESLIFSPTFTVVVNVLVIAWWTQMMQMPYLSNGYGGSTEYLVLDCELYLHLSHLCPTPKTIKNSTVSPTLCNQVP